MSDRNPFSGAGTDRRQSAYLGDVGGGLESYAVTTEISSDGCTIGFWIEDRSTPDFRCTAGWKTVPEHEQVGPLPDRWKYRIELAQTRLRIKALRAITPRCGRPTAHGTKCLNRVREDGQPCHRHAEAVR
ncbi:hypothetical protein ACJH6H_01125 [Mycobacterium sp. SMC-21]|uniref:hypothetical protein n=1 Tax=Mycobacterium sp. SMC-21 TaxID=3381632 RepID=UPI003875C6A4